MADFGATWAKIWNDLIYPIIAFIGETFKIDLSNIKQQ